MADDNDSPDRLRRGLIAGGSLAAGLALSGAAKAQTEKAVQTEALPTELNGQPLPEPPPKVSAGPVRPGRGSSLVGKTAIVASARSTSSLPMPRSSAGCRCSR